MTDLYYVLAFVAICCVYYYAAKKRNAVKVEEAPKQTAQSKSVNEKPQRPDDCCGAHEVCEKESLINSKIKPEYYDDEELDAFVGRTADSYDEDEVRQFADVFYTLKDYDVAGWLKSLQTRNIELPESLRDEALLIVQERRYGTKDVGVESSSKNLTFDVVLTSNGNDSQACVNMVKEETGLSLLLSKNAVDNIPSVIKEGVSKAEAEAIQARFLSAGFDVEIR